MSRAERDADIEILSDTFKKGQIAILANYSGLSVSKITELRRELRRAGSKARVVKNTLARISFKKAVNGSSSSSEKDRFLNELNGPNLLIHSDSDPVAPTKVLAKFAKQNESFKIRGGWLEGAFLDSAGINALSKMPGKAEILGQLVGLIATPASQLVRMLSAPGAQLVRVIEAHRKNLESKGS